MKKRPNINAQKGHCGPKKDLTDNELWRLYASKINPVSDDLRNYNIEAINYSYSDTAPKTTSPSRSRPPSRPPKISKPATVPSKTFEHGQADGLDRASQRKMRRGQVSLEGRLDLHGLTQTEAHRSLHGFLERAYVTGKKTVLVITGKGLTRNGDIGVLRKAVPKWLNEPPMKTWIRGFDYAAPSDGGEGALYILIRRKR